MTTSQRRLHLPVKTNGGRSGIHGMPYNVSFQFNDSKRAEEVS